MINELYSDNKKLYEELQLQTYLIDKADKFEKERSYLVRDKNILLEKCNGLEKSFDSRLNHEINKVDMKYRETINELETENKFLQKVVDKFKSTITKFISWVCHKFECPSEENLVRDFEKETGLDFDVEKQVLNENRHKEKKWEMEL